MKSTNGNEDLEQKHIMSDEIDEYVIAQWSSCWIISPIEEESGLATDCNVKLIESVGYGEGSSDKYKNQKLSKDNLSKFLAIIDWVKELKGVD